MARQIPDEVMLARLRREAAAREALEASLRQQISDLAGDFKSQVTQLESRARLADGSGESLARIIEVRETFASGTAAMAQRIDRLEVKLENERNPNAFIDELRRVEVDGDSALAETRLHLHAEIAGNKSDIEETLTAYATLDHVATTKTETLTAAAGTAQAKVDLEAEARIDADGTVAARWSVEVNANGKVAGLRIGSESNLAGTAARSTVDFQANVFRISTNDSVDGTAVAPFTLSGSTLELNALLVVNGQTLGDMQANASVPPLHDVGAFASAPSASSFPVNSVYRNTTDGNSYVRTPISTWALFLPKGATGNTGLKGDKGDKGDTGDDGNNGNPGERGSKSFYATTTATTWGTAQDAEADAAIIAASLTKVLLDQVTLSNGSTFAATRFWDGSHWQSIGQVINGNLLVNGTIGANALATHSVTAGKLLVSDLGEIAGSLTVGTGGTQARINSSMLAYGDPLGLHCRLNRFSETEYAFAFYNGVDLGPYFSRITTAGAAETRLSMGSGNSIISVGNMQLGSVAGVSTISLGASISMYSNTGAVAATSFNSTSSQRFKKNIRKLENALARVRALRGVEFDWLDGRAHDDVGVIAEEVEAQFPTLVARDAEGRVSGLEYGKLAAVLIEAVKELEAKVDALGI